MNVPAKFSNAREIPAARGAGLSVKAVAGRDAMAPLVFLPVLVLAARAAMPAWVFMWALAFAIFFGCKWLTLRQAHPPVRNLAACGAYLFGWIGMDPREFFGRATGPRPRVAEWAYAGGKTVAGAIIFWLAAHGAFELGPLAKGWLGMIGIVLMLHFGGFHLLALGWRATGRPVRPLMMSPLMAVSLGDFWGRRWNTAFHALVNKFVFRRLARSLGAAWATLAVFVASGVVHDLVISLPARGGYGLPTLYFLAQGAGILFERSAMGRRLKLGFGMRGWLFTFAVAAGPAGLLFHPPFVHRVILPMLDFIATKGNIL